MGKPKLNIHIPGLPQKNYEYRRGDSTLVFDSKKHAILIDGGEGELWTKMRGFMEEHDLLHVTCILTHWHQDHDCALRAALEARNIIVDQIICPPIWELNTIPDGKGEYRRAASIIGLARELDKPIEYLEAGKTRWLKIGDIRVWLWRRKANPNDYVNYQVNNTSISAYFPDLCYWTMGDAITSDAAYFKSFKKKRPIIGFKANHHGNAEGEDDCDTLEAAGAKICWYNDWEPSGTEIGGTNFSKYGAKNCARHFITLRPFKDIDIVADGEGHVIWKQGTQKWTFDVDYGKSTTTPAVKPVEQTETVSKLPKFRDMTELHGVDVSFAQGKIDWDTLANKIDFAIIQCGYGQNRTSQDDKHYLRNVEACERLGIPYGIYLYGYATTTTSATGEAEHALRQAKGRILSLPVYYDIEERRMASIAQGAMSAFGLKVESAGYWAGLYTGEYYYNANLRGVNRFSKWIAKYGTNNGKPQSRPNISGVPIWQYSSRGKLSGITGYVDVNLGSDLIKQVTGKDYIQAAKDVWAGKYGTEPERPEKLKAEGYDPRIVQHFVNRLVAK